MFQHKQTHHLEKQQRVAQFGTSEVAGRIVSHKLEPLLHVFQRAKQDLLIDAILVYEAHLTHVSITTNPCGMLNNLACARSYLT